MVDIRCNECGFDCDYSVDGEMEQVVFAYWNHMAKEHGIEYSPETLGRYVKKRFLAQIPS
ncbi:DUF1059 domain-containing protein [Nitrosopumilus sp.]|uniref:DUF1059 domain-containing protein n=1 Tax=Nitrosopumilus sp. TaxID=2024843 RepID=UPI003D0B9658